MSKKNKSKQERPSRNTTPLETAADEQAEAGVSEYAPALVTALVAVCAVGFAVAVFLVRHKLKLGLDPSYVSSCNLGGALNCDKVNASSYSEFLGLPIALYAAPIYALMAFLAVQALSAIKTATSVSLQQARLVLQSTALLALIAVVYSLFLAWVSTVWLRAYCLYCIGLYTVNLAAFLLAWKASGSPLPEVAKAPLRALASFAAPIPQALLVVGVSAGVALGAYYTAGSSMEAAYRGAIDAQFAAVDSASTGSATSESATSESAVESSADKQPAPASKASKVAPPIVAGRGHGKKTSEGWSMFETPIKENEFWLGNPDADVTIVKYADFQCAYCRMLSNSFKTVMAKYGDRVRLVMRHFPMNVKCNRSMKGFDKHPVACETAWAAHCAGEQGLFWKMHDLMYDNQPSLNVQTVDDYAAGAGADMDRFRSCLEAESTQAAIAGDVETAFRAGIYGTPRTYINDRLVTGSASASILEYYIEKALEAADSAEVEAATAPAGDGSSMVSVGDGSYWIDPYEAAITRDGRAVSQPGLEPARIDFFGAEEACGAAGKRLCSELEWVSACTGKTAEDNNSNGLFADDAIEGSMYPYGPYYEEGVCNDSADKKTGEPSNTGSRSGCRTASGLFDLAGNIGEWADSGRGRRTLLGGYASSKSGAACNRRTSTVGPGSRNKTTGFRCCADENVTTQPVDASMLSANVTDLLDTRAPIFSTTDAEGNAVSESAYKGKLTLLNFFASWCGPCKKEFPFLADYTKEFGPRGFQVIGVGVDSLASRSIEFAESYETNFPVITDPQAVLKGKYLVHSMPATFLVDGDGMIRYQSTGFDPGVDEHRLRAAIEALLKEPSVAQGR
ncbi:MAG: thioredoxin domain-containing protein [Proteobacteria bacterium]|nr:thioredoxin domain-containing protein [Pseudomonadota bacterium]